MMTEGEGAMTEGEGAHRENENETKATHPGGDMTSVVGTESILTGIKAKCVKCPTLCKANPCFRGS